MSSKITDDENIDYPYTEEELEYREDLIRDWESVLHKRYKTASKEDIETLAPAIAAAGVSEEIMVALMFRFCRNRVELRNWIKVFLDVDLPDGTVDPISNCNPLEMVWLLYETAVWYDNLETEDRVLRSIFYATRGGFKTYSLTIAELLIMLHGGRDTIHCALIEKQSKNAYNKYFRPFLDKPYVGAQKVSSILEQSIIKNQKGRDITLGVIPCTMNATSGPRAHLLVFDEIDKAKGEQLAAYQNAYGMRTATPDKKLPMTVGISTRDSSFGVIQDEIDNADKRGTKVYHWNIIDITERCPDSRSLTQPIPIYIRNESLYCVSEDQYKKLSSAEQRQYQKEWGLEGCLKNCKIFAACKGYLKNQKSNCSWLKSIEDTQQAILSAPSEDMAIAQLLCRKPPTTGLVFSDFTKTRNVKTATDMYRTFMGVDEGDVHINKTLTVEDFIDVLQEHDIPMFLGVDAGFHNPCAVLVAIDKQENIYVLKEYRPHNVDSPELAQHLGEYWTKYDARLAFSDPESPDCASALRKRGFRMSTKVDKAVQLGLSTLKGYIRVPGTDKGKFFIHADCKITVSEFAHKYKYKQNTDGTFSDDPEKKDDHGCDAVRYIIHTLLGQAKANLWSNILHSKEVTKEQIISRQLTPNEVSKKAYGQTTIIDNRKDFIESTDETGKKKKSRKTTSHDFRRY